MMLLPFLMRLSGYLLPSSRSAQFSTTAGK
jgi:hypothetical protein